MEVGICTSFAPGMPFETAIPLIVEAGFTTTSLGGVPELAGYDTQDNRRKLAKLLRQYHLGIDSVHAPFPEGDQLFSEFFNHERHEKPRTFFRVGLES